MKKVWAALIVVGISQSCVAHLNGSIFNQIEPYILCWLYHLKQAGEQVSKAIDCKDAFDLHSDDFFDDIMKDWVLVRSFYGWCGGLASLLAQPLVDRLGKYKIMFVASGLNILSCIVHIILPYIESIDDVGSSTSSSYSSYKLALAMYSIAQILAGIQLGLATVAAVTYAIEIAPLEKRGIFGATYMIFGCLGLFSTFLSGTSFFFGTEDLWQLNWVLPLLFSSLIFLSFLVPESPIFYFKKQDNGNVYKMMQELYGSEWREVKLDFSSAKLELKLEHNDRSTSRGTSSEEKGAKAKPTKDHSIFSHYKAIWKNEALRSSMYMSAILLCLNYTSGSVLLSSLYTSLILSKLDVGRNTIQYVTLAVGGGVRLIFNVLGGWAMEKCGRKKLMVPGFGLMAVCMFAFTYVAKRAGLSDDNASSDDDDDDEEKLESSIKVAIFILIFFVTIINDLAITSPAWTFPSEIMPIEYKSSAQAIGAFAAWSSVGINNLWFPLAIKDIGEYTFIIFGIINLCAGVYVWVFIPECKNKESIDLQQRVSLGIQRRRSSIQSISRKMSISRVSVVE